jgi:hypothetical protein
MLSLLRHDISSNARRAFLRFQRSAGIPVSSLRARALLPVSTHALSIHTSINWTVSRSLCSLPPTPPSILHDNSLSHITTKESNVAPTDMSKSVEDRLYAIIHGVNGAKFRLFIRAQIKDLSEDPDVVALAKSKYIEEKLWSFHAFNFRRKLAKAPEKIFQGAQLIQFLTLVEDILDKNEKEKEKHLTDANIDKNQDQFRSLLLSTMMHLADSELREEIASSLTLLSCSDLRLPHEWYAPARLMKRKIIFHGGPTNSGAFTRQLLRGSVLVCFSIGLLSSLHYTALASLCPYLCVVIHCGDMFLRSSNFVSF